MHLDHCMCTCDRADIVKYAKHSFWSRFNIFRADLGHIVSRRKLCYFKNIVRIFYGSPLLPLEGPRVRSLCVGWRNAMIYVWPINTRFIYIIHISIYGIHVTKQVKLKIQLEY